MTMGQEKILIVDDSAVFVKAASLYLKSKGYQVFAAQDGASAISAVRREKPDLILLDISFPPDVAHGGGISWDGFGILGWLRRMDEAKGVPVIIITAGGPGKEKDAYTERCRPYDVAAFFLKPVDHEELLKTIRQVLEGPVPT